MQEQIHSDQSAQFQSQLMTDLCKTWGVNQSQMTPKPAREWGCGEEQPNARVSLRSLLICKSQKSGTWCCHKLYAFNILREIYDILSEDALNYPVIVFFLLHKFQINDIDL